jgi:hypothetical protein
MWWGLRDWTFQHWYVMRDRDEGDVALGPDPPAVDELGNISGGKPCIWHTYAW